MDTVARYSFVAVAGLLFGIGPAWTHLAFLALYPLASGRNMHAWGLVATFYFVGLFPIVWVAHDYTGVWHLSLLPWLIPSLVNVALVGFALSRSTSTSRALCTMLCVVALAVPPLSTFSVMSPAPLAGLLFPGTGLSGIALLLGLIGLLSIYRDISANRIVFSALGLALLTGQALAASTIDTAARTQRSITGIDTYRGMPSEEQQRIFATAWRFDELQQAEHSGSNTVVLPESTFGQWHTVKLEPLKSTSVEIIGGARQQISESEYNNVLVSNKRGILYRQREPIPYSFARSNSPSKTHASTNDNKIAALLCVELANPWVVNSTFVSATKEVIWAANLGWSKQSWLLPRMKAQAEQYARLYGKPVVIAINHPENVRG